jgi:hypothetical protein
MTFWYSADGASGDQMLEVWSVPDGLLTSRKVEELPLGAFREGVDGVPTDAFVQFAFASTATLAAGSLAIPTCTAELNVEVHSGTSWQSGFIPANDWSYLATTAFADNSHVTLALAGALLWGTEPAKL